MKKQLLALTIAAAFSAPMFAQAEAGDWVVRIRAVNVMPNESSSLGSDVNTLLGATVMSPSAELAVDNNVIPELDISYYFTKHIAAELILALGTEHDVSITGDNLGTVGNQNLGEVDLLPPTLTLQWHFNPDEKIDPYVGAGLNYTLALNRDLKGSAGAINGNSIKVERSSIGFAFQAGVDINLDNGWLLNADVKYLDVNTDVQLNGAVTGNVWRKIDDLDVNPWVIGFGVGKRF